MTILVTLTTAGADSGPFNLYSDVDGYQTPFATGIPKQELIDGYPTVAPDGTMQVMVSPIGACQGSVIFIPTGLVTTTSTSSSSTSTTSSSTTPAPPPTFALSFGATTQTAACNLVFYPNTPLYSLSASLGVGVTLYRDIGLTVPFTGGLLWYKWFNSGKIFKIRNTGYIEQEALCI